MNSYSLLSFIQNNANILMLSSVNVNDKTNYVLTECLVPIDVSVTLIVVPQ